jgi:hypothetical protein
MDTNMLDLPTTDTEATIDPVLERALFFAEYDLIELRATIPQAEPQEPKWVY